MIADGYAKEKAVLVLESAVFAKIECSNLVRESTKWIGPFEEVNIIPGGVIVLEDQKGKFEVATTKGLSTKHGDSSSGAMAFDKKMLINKRDFDLFCENEKQNLICDTGFEWFGQTSKEPMEEEKDEARDTRGKGIQENKNDEKGEEKKSLR
ncbi:hypothetical protein ACH5RR_037023 [Cinchona calisaya]|uniref:Uncharacterized protein n=1 Tax=Cinchona calisaya TaxID=153742 RepID=A0ABD2Y4Y1_9GENT